MTDRDTARAIVESYPEISFKVMGGLRLILDGSTDESILDDQRESLIAFMDAAEKLDEARKNFLLRTVSNFRF